MGEDAHLTRDSTTEQLLTQHAGLASTATFLHMVSTTRVLLKRYMPSLVPSPFFRAGRSATGGHAGTRIPLTTILN